MNLDNKKLNELFDIENSEPSKPEGSEPQFNNEVKVDDSELTINVAEIYTQLNSLIKTGNEILENSKYTIETNPDDSEAVQAASSIINALRDTVKEFNKLHIEHLKHGHAKELELLKIQGRKESILLKSSEAQKMMAKNNPGLLGNDESNVEDLISYSQEDVIKSILDIEKQQSLPPSENIEK